MKGDNKYHDHVLDSAEKELTAHLFGKEEEQTTTTTTQPAKKRKKNSEKEAPAWTDPDDQAISVNLQAVKRIKKLRNSLKETVIKGTDLQERLQEQ